MQHGIYLMVTPLSKAQKSLGGAWVVQSYSTYVLCVLKSERAPLSAIHTRPEILTVSASLLSSVSFAFPLALNPPSIAKCRQYGITAIG